MQALNNGLRTTTSTTAAASNRCENPFEAQYRLIRAEFARQFPTHEWRLMSNTLNKVQRTSGLANGLFVFEVQARPVLSGTGESATLGAPVAFKGLYVGFDKIFFSLKDPVPQSAAGVSTL